MKALLPVYCRILGYCILLLAIFAPFVLFMYGSINNENLQLYKEMIKGCIMVGLLVILLARTKGENEETGIIRIKAMRNAFFLTILFIFINMGYRLYEGDITAFDSSSFIIFMALNVLCLEYRIKKAKADKLFRK